MQTAEIISRIVHIGFGVFWAGTIFFFAFMLEPSIRAAGPGGGRVMQELMRRKFLNIVPIAALLTILSGLDMYWRFSGGMSGEWMATGYGISLTIGAVCALVAFGIGVFLLRPTAMKIGKLGASMADLEDEGEKQTRMAEMDGLKSYNRLLGRIVASMLLVSVVTMSIARYV
jgi:hypothetical protein